MKREFDRLISEAQSICILGHTNPDGDCLGSCLGIRKYIKNIYPEKDPLVCLMKASDKFKYLPGFESILNSPPERKFDLSIICDCATLDRLGDFKVLSENADEHYIIDHHITNACNTYTDNHSDDKCSGDESISDNSGIDIGLNSTIRPNASSASEIAFDLMDPEGIDKDVAICLYTGIVHDTGVFKYTCTSPRTMEVAAVLMGKGIDFGNIIDDSFYMSSYSQQQVLGKVLLESRLCLDDRILLGTLTLKEMSFYKVAMKDIDGIVATMRETRGIDAAVFIYEVKHKTYKASLRSNNIELDVARTASKFGGGGHKMASGCSLSGDMAHIIELLLEELKVQLDASGFHSQRDN